MKEEWQDIAGYEGLYQVSNLGRVKSLNYKRTGKEIILVPGNCRGYLFVTLYKNGKVKSYYLHRLVGQAFLENPDNSPEVNHIDQNKQNNCISNLEWCSSKYNNRYSNAKKVGCFKDGKLIKKYDAIADVEKEGFYQSNVIRCCQGKRKSAGGYHWQYLD